MPAGSVVTTLRARVGCNERAGTLVGHLGAIAQLGERLDRTQEVGGSSPPSSIRSPWKAGCFVRGSGISRRAPTRSRRRLERARRLLVSRALTDLAGLDVTAEDFLAGVLEAAAQPIWVVDRDDVIRFANPAAIAALGYGHADELFGRRSHETIHYQHRDGTPIRPRSARCCSRGPPARRSRATWTGSSAATARRSPSPTSRFRSRCATVAARWSPSPTSRTASPPNACCASTTRPWQRSRRRCSGSRRSWPAGRRRRTCSPPLPRRSATSPACPWSRCGATSPTRRRPCSAPGAIDSTRSRPAPAGRSTGRPSPPVSGTPAARRGSTTSPTSPARSPGSPAKPGSAPAQVPRSSWTARSGVRCRRTRPTPRRCRTTSRIGSSSSPSCSPRRSRPPPGRTSSPSVRTSRPRCGASRRLSLAASPRPSSSQRSSARSPSTWM